VKFGALNIIAVGQGYEICDPEHPENYAIKLIDGNTGDELDQLISQYCTVRFLDWNSDGTKLLSTGGADASGKGVVWDVGLKQRVAISPPVSMPGRLMDRWSVDDSRVLSVSEAYPTVNIWDPVTGDTTLSIPTGIVDAAAWSPDGQQIITGPESPTIWDAVTGEHVLTLSAPEAPLGVTAAVWSADNSRIFTGGADGLIHVWDVETKVFIRTLVGHSGFVSGLALSHDNTRLASAGHDRTVRVWNAETGELIETFSYPERVHAVDWSPSGDKIAYGGDGASGNTPQVEIVDAPVINAASEATATP
jgi:WD40 repeat protein